MFVPNLTDFCSSTANAFFFKKYVAGFLPVQQFVRDYALQTFQYRWIFAR